MLYGMVVVLSLVLGSVCVAFDHERSRAQRADQIAAHRLEHLERRIREHDVQNEALWSAIAHLAVGTESLH